MILEWLATKQITYYDSAIEFIERRVKKPDFYAIILGVEPTSNIAIDKRVYSSLIYDNQHGRYLCEYKYSYKQKENFCFKLTKYEAQEYIDFYKKRGAKAIYEIY